MGRRQLFSAEMMPVPVEAANFPCTVRTHPLRRVFNDLGRCHLRQKTSFAGDCAPTVHQDLLRTIRDCKHIIANEFGVSTLATRAPRNGHLARGVKKFRGMAKFVVRWKEAELSMPSESACAAHSRSATSPGMTT